MHPYSEQPLQLFSLEYKEEVSLVKLKLLKVSFSKTSEGFFSKEGVFVHECVWYYSLLAGSSLVNMQIRSITCLLL